MTRRGGPSDRPTVRDVAAAAGVSPATAARALGGYGRVSAEVRARVQAQAAALRYRPNTLARSMITGTTHTLGVVIADIENSFFARAVRGITDAAHAAGFEVILVNSDEDPAKERAAVGVLLAKQVDGLLVAAASTTEVAHIREAVAQGLPVVCLDRVVPDLAADAVVVDNQRAAHNATSHLARLGHRRIAIIAASEPSLPDPVSIAGAPPWGPAGVLPDEARVGGYLTALRSADLQAAEELIRRCPYGRATAREQTEAVLALDDPPTAIFATDAIVTLGAMEGIVAMGRQIPGDVSVIGFDDAEWTTIIQPPLTVVAQPVYELGASATRRLLARIAGDERPPEVLMLETTFLLRGSTGRPREPGAPRVGSRAPGTPP